MKLYRYLFNRTPLFVAVEYEYLEIIKTLLSSENLDINLVNVFKINIEMIFKVLFLINCACLSVWSYAHLRAGALS